MSTEITLPDIGDFDEVEIIEIAVQPGDAVRKEDTLLTLESDKATMDIPSPHAGVVESLLVKVGDRIGQGHPIVKMEIGGGGDAAQEAEADSAEAEVADAKEDVVSEPDTAAAQDTTQDTPSSPEPSAPRPPPAAPIGSQVVGGSQSEKAHASPSVRRFARELGVDLGLVYGTGPKKRITKDDVKAFTKSVLSGNKLGATGGYALPEIPPVAHPTYGEVETRELSRLKRRAGQNLQRSWFSVPHVTQFDEADITDLEDFRKSRLPDAEQRGVKLTVVAFLVKAVVDTLQRHPEFNSSLTSDGQSLVLKKYFHIGVAVNTDQGLMVPVIKDADQKGLFQIAKEIRDLSEQARAGKMPPADLQGGCFTISSLGGIGGKHFTPIINAPEVAILGVSRATRQPVWDGDAFAPRLIMPIALSYDHRVIDGVAGAQFTRSLCMVLSDIRQILL